MTSVLTDKERIAIRQATKSKTTGAWSDSLAYSSAIEAAVIKRLAAGVSVEPDGWHTQEYIGAPSQQEPYYNADTFTTAIAAARVQAIEECAKVCETPHPYFNDCKTNSECATAIRSLLRKEAT